MGGMSYADRQRLADMERQLAAIRNQLTPSLGMGLGVSTNQGGLNYRTTQLGFAAELTSTYDEGGSDTGYAWKLLALQTTATAGLVDPSIQLTGDKAFEINGDESLAPETRVWMEPDQNAGGYVFQVSASSPTPPPPAPCGGCGFFAGATEYDCWTVTVVGAGGNMASVSTGQELALTWDAAADYWESADDFVVCDFEGVIRLSRNADGDPELLLVAPNYVMTLSCCDPDTQTMYFSGGNSGETVLCCARETNEGPKENLFTLAVTWNPCPNPDYTAPGWYCIAVTSCAGSRECCYLEEDPGLGVVICSGPHEAEEDCAALCTSEEPVPVLCNDVPYEIPRTLFVTVVGVTGNCNVDLIGSTSTVAYSPGFGWLGSMTTACGGVMDVVFQPGAPVDPDVACTAQITIGPGPDDLAWFLHFTTNTWPTSNSPYYLTGEVQAFFAFGLDNTCCPFGGGTIQIIVTE
jgi:hypothetical protein